MQTEAMYRQEKLKILKEMNKSFIKMACDINSIKLMMEYGSSIRPRNTNLK